MTDVFDDVIAERDRLKQQVEELRNALQEMAHDWKHNLAALQEAEQQVAMLANALEQIRTFEPQLVESALAGVRGERT